MRNPYIIGASVTGRDHYGREELITTLLAGGARAHWIVGNRRVGKTSLLRQLELVAPLHGALIPLYWNLEGCASYADLGAALADALRDHLERFAPLAITSALADEADALTLLAHLRRLATRGHAELLLLCDETEALLPIATAEPAALQRLHRTLTGGAGLRTVMVSTREVYRLYDICRAWPTSPFLAGFDMSHTLGSLEPADARKLILQSQAPRGSKVKAGAAVISAIKDATNNHPLLLQLLCARLLQEDGSLALPDAAALRVDSMIASFLEYDLGQLTDADRELLLGIHALHRADPRELERLDFEQPAELKQRVANLVGLGYLRKTGTAAKPRYAIGNAFLQSWLDARPGQLADAPVLRTSADAMHAVFARQRERDVGSLVMQLNLRRSRQVELELVRAEQLLAASPQLFAEIGQLESEIADLRTALNERSG